MGVSVGGDKGKAYMAVDLKTNQRQELVAKGYALAMPPMAL